MLNTENNINAEKRRLAWRCRRGLLELDIVLQRFVAHEFEGLNKQELIAFDGLLALPDNDFWAILSSQAIVEKTSADKNRVAIDADTAKVILKIQSMHRER